MPNELENNLQLDLKEEVFVFPEDFLWGTSTSAYQIEGGATNDWSVWEKERVKSKKFLKTKADPNDYICGSACDSYNRYEEDFVLAQSLNTNAIRFGLEWARIEPDSGVWDVEAINHYRKMLESAKNKGFSITLTLWHWTNPVWFANDFGWNDKMAVERFLLYVETAVKEFGSYVDHWVILNEPMIVSANGWLSGKWPPNKFNPLNFLKMINNLTNAQKGAYRIIHEHYPEAKVGLTMLANFIEPARRWCPVEWLIAKGYDFYTNRWFLNKIRGSFDFIGIDYYFHDRIVWYPPFKKNINKEVTDMGWEIFPEGIYHVLKELSSYEKPLFIMENGIADANDDKRARFIVEHLKYVHRAIKEGVDVRGYFYWSLLDNFEWAHGFTQKFGLFAVDRQTFTRTKRKSADVYGEICRSGQVINL